MKNKKIYLEVLRFRTKRIFFVFIFLILKEKRTYNIFLPKTWIKLVFMLIIIITRVIVE